VVEWSRKYILIVVAFNNRIKKVNRGSQIFLLVNMKAAKNLSQSTLVSGSAVPSVRCESRGGDSLLTGLNVVPHTQMVPMASISCT
jgi:hypothetical protein